MTIVSKTIFTRSSTIEITMMMMVTEAESNSMHDDDFQLEACQSNVLVLERDEAFKRCQEAGKHREYENVIEFADEVFEVMRKLKVTPARKNSKRDNSILASVNGYRGFALMKQDMYSAAIHYLEVSKALRRRILDDEHYNGDQLNDTNAKTIEHSRDDPIRDHGNSMCQRRQRREEIAVEQALKNCYSKVSDPSCYSTPNLVKYPRTTHLFDSGGTATTTDDLVLPDLSAVSSMFCDGRRRVIIEEKVDGSNLGISKCPISGKLLVQNRSHYISNGDHIQYSRINEWIEEHRQALNLILQDGNRILYGEWVVARHSIPYKRLPGLFVAFDIYDKKAGRFFSRCRFHFVMRDSRIPVVPIIQTRTFGPYTTQSTNDFRRELLPLLDTRSVFRNDGGTVEGVVLRVDDDCNYSTENPSATMIPSDWLRHKFKIVRPDFLRGCGDGHHLMTRQIEKQIVDFEYAESYLHECYVFASPKDQEVTTNG